jgi:predicted amidohydrolase
LKTVPKISWSWWAPRKEKWATSYNAAFALSGGKIRARYHKWFLPNYGVFDEERYFREGVKPTVLDLGGVRIGLTICEDIWRPKGPALAASELGASLILNLSASPYHAGKTKQRLAILRKKSRECGTALAYCNMVGGQDELVYDGGSTCDGPPGNRVALAPLFKEHFCSCRTWICRKRSRPSGRNSPFPARIGNECLPLPPPFPLP